MDERITAKEAARMLGVTTRMVRYWTRKGIIRPFKPGGSVSAVPMYLRTEIDALLEARSKKVDLQTVATMARQAHVSSRQLERTVSRLLEIIGANIPMLSLKEENVHALYLQVEDALEQDYQPPADEVLEWARIFYAVGEEYLGLIEEVVEDEEPWAKLLELSNSLSVRAPRDLFSGDKELEAAYGYLEMARRNMRNVAYFYIRNRHGSRAASGAFPGTGDITEEVIALAFPEF
jgi:hypothetical protein